MSEEDVIEEVAETSTETDDAEISAPEVEPTETSDAEGEEAEAQPDAATLKSQLEKAEKKLAKTSYEQREARRREERLLSMLESTSNKRSEPQAPKIDDFETLDEYVDARFQYLSRQSEPKASPAENGNAAVFHQKREDLMFEGSGKYKDFADKVTSADVVITPAMAEAIFELDDMDTQVELAYALASNPRESSRIARLSPLRQAAEIGKLEAKLSMPKTAKRQPSTAPAPIKPVGGTKTPANEIRDVMDPKEFIRIRNKQLGRV